MPDIFIDIHTHNYQSAPKIFRLWNQIIGRDDTKDILSSAGIHPWYIQQNVKMQLELLTTIVQQKNILAVGECGLDKICDTPFLNQINVFSKQIALANEIEKPLIIHCVRAYDQVIEQLKQHKNKVPVLFHGVNKKYALIESLHQKGYYTSLGAYILQGYHDDTIKYVDLSKIFLETDDLSTNIEDIYYYFCRVRNITIEQLQYQLIQNVSNVFNYNIVSH